MEPQCHVCKDGMLLVYGDQWGGANGMANFPLYLLPAFQPIKVPGMERARPTGVS